MVLWLVGQLSLTLLFFSDFCTSAFNNSLQVDVVYTDFSKAFDKVCHSTLISKLISFGFHSIFLKWIKSYLFNRECVVVLDNVSSYSFIASSGVPQGSILGPLFFVIFINDISECFHFSEFLLYADDLKIFKTVLSLSDSHNLQSDLNNVAAWCDRNRLELNIKKCSHVSFSKSKHLISTSYFIKNSRLNTLNEITDLGVIFDSTFQFLSHLNFIIAKSYSTLAFIRRFASDFTDPYTLKSLFTSLVRSKLEYAVFIWRPYHQCHINRIERIQKKFLRFALRSLNFTEPIPSYNARCELLNLKMLQSRRSILSLCFVFDIINGTVDSPLLLERIHFHIPQKNLRSNDLFFLERVRTVYASKAPLIRTLNEFNQISNSLALDLSLSKYRFKLSLNGFFK